MSNKVYVGLDIHKETIAMVAHDEAGKSIVESIIATDAGLVRRSLSGLGEEVYVTFEVGTQSNWIYREIKPVVKQVIVCNSRENNLLLTGNKSDLIDARKLAQLLRLGSLKPVWQHSSEQLYLKELVRTYENLVEDSTRVKNRLKAIYRATGVKSSDKSFYRAEGRSERIDKLPEKGSRLRSEVLFRELDVLLELRQQIKQKMIAEAKQHDDFKRLCSIPGLGPISVAQIITQVGDPHRFKTKRAFWKYCGFAVETRSSADHQFINGKLTRRIRQISTRGLSRDYCHRLKNVFKTATLKALQQEPFSLYYENLLRKGTKESLARVSVARKIAAACLSIWKKKSQFNKHLATANQK